MQVETFFKENLGVPFSDGVPFNLFGVAKVVTSAAFREFLRIVIIITCWKGLVCKVSKVVLTSHQHGALLCATNMLDGCGNVANAVSDPTIEAVVWR